MNELYACVRCGDLSPAEHCDDCDDAYYAEEQQSRDSSYIVVAFDGINGLVYIRPGDYDSIVLDNPEDAARLRKVIAQAGGARG